MCAATLAVEGPDHGEAGPAAEEPEPQGAPVRADAGLVRTGQTALPGGVLFVPQTFSSEDGAYDLYVHFHGAPRVVLEGAEAARLDALVAVMNAGVRSTQYEEAYAQPRAFAEALAAVRRAAAERGLSPARLRRVALGSWSAGYAAIAQILAHGKGAEAIDAILVADGIHATFVDPGTRQPSPLKLAPFVAAARRAARGELLFTITHSTAVPEAFASSTATADYLLGAVGAARARSWEDEPPHLVLASAGGYLTVARDTRMVPITQAAKGCFEVRGYAGGQAEHHLAHFVQMGATLLPELAARWRR